MRTKIREVAYPDIKHRNKLVRNGEIKLKIEECINKKCEGFYSVFYYYDEIYEYLKNNKSVAGYPGVVGLDAIILDIDKREDGEEALNNARECYNILMQAYDLDNENIDIYFSGSGFHIIFDNYFDSLESPNYPELIKNKISEMFPKADTKIYIKTGLIRMPYTINKKTNLYKIKLFWQEFNTMSYKDIAALALSNEIRDVPKRVKRNDIKWLLGSQEKATRTAYTYEQLNIKPGKLTRIVTCGQKMFEAGPIKGERHATALRMVSIWKRGGVSRGGAIAMLRDWISRNPEDFDDEEIIKIVDYCYDKTYNYSCADEILSKYCDKMCMFYRRKNYGMEVTDASKFRELMQNYLVKTKQFGLDLSKIFGFEKSYAIRPGELVSIFADTKMGKSAFAQNIVVRSGLRTLYMSLENGKELDIRRMLQIAYNKTKAEIEADIFNEREGLYAPLSNIMFLDYINSNEELREQVSINNPQLVVIDTLDQLPYSGKNYFDRVEYWSVQLKDLAISANIAIIVIHHISKQAAKKEKGLDVHSGKGSSALEQKSDKVIGIDGKMNSCLRNVKSLATRDDSNIDELFWFKPETFRFELHKIGD